MDISGISSSFSQTSASGSSKDVEQQIKDLEAKKVKLQQELKEEDSPFALTQSKECESIQKRIEQLDQQIQQLKASENSGSDQAGEVTASLESNNNSESTKIRSRTKQFDEFIRSEDQPKEPSTGIYTVSYDEKGKPIASFGLASEDKDESKEEEQNSWGLEMNSYESED